MTKTVTKSKPRQRSCGWCKAKFKPPTRGRPPLYCCQSCRQRAYEERRAAQFAGRQLPKLLLGKDIEDMRTKAGIRRAIIDVLSEVGLLPESPAPQRSKPRLSLVEDDDNA